jgi:putative heme iron utilization protein
MFQFDTTLGGKDVVLLVKGEIVRLQQGEAFFPAPMRAGLSGSIENRDCQPCAHLSRVLSGA